MGTMTNTNQDKKVEAFRFLKSLKRGDEVWVSTGGQEEQMFVTRELVITDPGEFKQLGRPVWEYANVHVSPGLGSHSSSITVQQQYKQQEELPYITGKLNDVKVRVVEIGPELYERIDELAGNSKAKKQLASSFKNMISKRAKQVPEDILT